MANVIPFPSRNPSPQEEAEVDLITAVDVAIRDLRDIARGCDELARQQADECRFMLERAFAAAVLCQG